MLSTSENSNEAMPLTVKSSAMNDSANDNPQLTLDPPGSIAIVGAGTHGIEAGLYGRFLGYDVTVLEKGVIGQNMLQATDEDLTVLPDQCLSPLALSAVTAQHAAENPSDPPLTFPTTVREWVYLGLVPLSESDLLRGRVETGKHVTNIAPMEVEQDNATEDVADFPADFLLTHIDANGLIETLHVEAVIIATGEHCDIQFGFALPFPYLFRIGPTTSTDNQGMHANRRRIVEIYSQLAGRSDLDLYRPQRV